MSSCEPLLPGGTREQRQCFLRGEKSQDSHVLWNKKDDNNVGYNETVRIIHWTWLFLGDHKVLIHMATQVSGESSG